ncbi:MAG: DUF4336 domain-containing protein [Myxacorys chilensis ATA2-1-KO14]|nr:DUF4336 domain-containing protein [Myxacorys chilensis ATA2-1-KO14]
MLRQLDTDIWVAEQPFRYFGLSVGTRMTVIRLANRTLAIISPIQMDDALTRQLDEIGTVSHIIAPNLYHYLFAANCKALYPKATFWAAPGLEFKKPDLAIDQTISKDGNRLLNEVEYVVFDGFRTVGLTGFEALNECVFFHAESHSVILTDIAFHFDERFPLITQFATRVLGGYKTLSPSLLERVATREKERVRRSVEKVLAWNFERVIMAHGSIIETGGKQRFREGYEQFLGHSIQ